MRAIRARATSLLWAPARVAWLIRGPLARFVRAGARFSCVGLGFIQWGSTVGPTPILAAEVAGGSVQLYDPILYDLEMIFYVRPAFNNQMPSKLKIQILGSLIILLFHGEIMCMLSGCIKY